MLGFNRMQKNVGKHATASIGLALFGVGNALVPLFPMLLVGLTPGAGSFNTTGNNNASSGRMDSNASTMSSVVVVGGGALGVPVSEAARIGSVVGCKCLTHRVLCMVFSMTMCY